MRNVSNPIVQLVDGLYTRCPGVETVEYRRSNPSLYVIRITHSRVLSGSTVFRGEPFLPPASGDVGVCVSVFGTTTMPNPCCNGWEDLQWECGMQQYQPQQVVQDCMHTLELYTWLVCCSVLQITPCITNRRIHDLENAHTHLSSMQPT